MTAAKLGEEVGVSESTVVRFANEIGLTVIQNYKKFKRMNKSKLTAVQRIEVTSSRINEGTY